MRDLREDPEFLRYYAAVLIREAVLRKSHGDGSFTEFLIAGAERAKREATQLDARRPAQGDLFAELFA